MIPMTLLELEALAKCAGGWHPRAHRANELSAAVESAADAYASARVAESRAHSGAKEVDARWRCHLAAKAFSARLADLTRMVSEPQ